MSRSIKRQVSKTKMKMQKADKSPKTAIRSKIMRDLENEDDYYLNTKTP